MTTLLACYDVLGELAQEGGSSARVTAWERPWRRPVRLASGHGLRRVSVPAAVTLAWSLPEGERRRSFLVLPDLGGIDPRTWRPRLLQLLQLQQAYDERLPALLVVTTSEARARAWTWALADTASSRPGLSLDATIRIARTRAGLPCLYPVPGACPQRTAPRLEIPVGARDLQLLDALGRHPFLTTSLLASLLGHDQRSTRARLRRLLDSDLVRTVSAAELGDLERQGDASLELTRTGLITLAAYLGLPSAAAVRLHSLAGGGPSRAFGPRPALLAHTAHTRAADRVMVGLAAAVRTDTREARLSEWRNAAACAHGRLRPDAYGLLRVAGHDCGFFLELDRATMRPAELRAKFVAYHRFRTSRRASELYTSFPTVLAITTGPGAERRLAEAVRSVDASYSSPLPVLLTTTAWIDAQPRGMLGAIWRQPYAGPRVRWPRLKQEGVPHAR